MQLQLGYILYHHSFFLIVAYLFSRYMFTLFSLPTQCQSLRKARWNLTRQPSTLQQRYQSPNSRTMAIIFWQFWCLTLPENQRYRSGFRDVWRDFDCSGVGEAGDEAERQDISTTTSRRIISITLDRWLNKLLFWRFGSEKRWKIRATESVEGVKSWSLRSEGRMRRRYRSGASHPGKDLILLHNIAIWIKEEMHKSRWISINFWRSSALGLPEIYRYWSGLEVYCLKLDCSMVSEPGGLGWC